ncbi:hypothetical protein Moror_9733 [Moniliophthora roreri MCA 2997]|uniref:Uncharacterized protein n=1 Tax=Moniliophthora roreri (strain MCA 2997) TaxID=1381753 RepID=V2WIH6_MONRO|nr:hypothetical protein Moror_9733 [Moniliophthora roreri MCA 2997]
MNVDMLSPPSNSDDELSPPPGNQLVLIQQKKISPASTTHNNDQPAGPGSGGEEKGAGDGNGIQGGRNDSYSAAQHIADVINRSYTGGSSTDNSMGNQDPLPPPPPEVPMDVDEDIPPAPVNKAGTDANSMYRNRQTSSGSAPGSRQPSIALQKKKTAAMIKKRPAEEERQQSDPSKRKPASKKKKKTTAITEEEEEEEEEEEGEERQQSDPSKHKPASKKKTTAITEEEEEEERQQSIPSKRKPASKKKTTATTDISISGATSASKRRKTAGHAGTSAPSPAASVSSSSNAVKGKVKAANTAKVPKTSYERKTANLGSKLRKEKELQEGLEVDASTFTVPIIKSGTELDISKFKKGMGIMHVLCEEHRDADLVYAADQRHINTSHASQLANKQDLDPLNPEYSLQIMASRHVIDFTKLATQSGLSTYPMVVYHDKSIAAAANVPYEVHVADGCHRIHVCELLLGPIWHQYCMLKNRLKQNEQLDEEEKAKFDEVVSKVAARDQWIVTVYDLDQVANDKYRSATLLKLTVNGAAQQLLDNPATFWKKVLTFLRNPASPEDYEKTLRVAGNFCKNQKVIGELFDYHRFVVEAYVAITKNFECFFKSELEPKELHRLQRVCWEFVHKIWLGCWKTVLFIFDDSVPYKSTAEMENIRENRGTDAIAGQWCTQVQLAVEKYTFKTVLSEKWRPIANIIVSHFNDSFQNSLEKQFAWEAVETARAAISEWLEETKAAQPTQPQIQSMLTRLEYVLKTGNLIPQKCSVVQAQWPLLGPRFLRFINRELLYIEDGIELLCTFLVPGMRFVTKTRKRTSRKNNSNPDGGGNNSEEETDQNGDDREQQSGKKANQSGKKANQSSQKGKSKQQSSSEGVIDLDADLPQQMQVTKSGEEPVTDSIPYDCFTTAAQWSLQYFFRRIPSNTSDKWPTKGDSFVQASTVAETFHAIIVLVLANRTLLLSSDHNISKVIFSKNLKQKPAFSSNKETSSRLLLNTVEALHQWMVLCKKAHGASMSAPVHNLIHFQRVLQKPPKEVLDKIDPKNTIGMQIITLMEFLPFRFVQPKDYSNNKRNTLPSLCLWLLGELKGAKKIKSLFNSSPAIHQLYAQMQTIIHRSWDLDRFQFWLDQVIDTTATTATTTTPTIISMPPTDDYTAKRTQALHRNIKAGLQKIAGFEKFATHPQSGGIRAHIINPNGTTGKAIKNMLAPEVSDATFNLAEQWLFQMLTTGAHSFGVPEFDDDFGSNKWKKVRDDWFSASSIGTVHTATTSQVETFLSTPMDDIEQGLIGDVSEMESESGSGSESDGDGSDSSE